MYDIFISYSSIDYKLAEQLNNRLLMEGFTVWFDKARLSPGCNWYQEIETGCENSRIFLPVLTPNWKESEWTKFETYSAESIIPLIYRDKWANVTTPPLEKYQAQAIDFGQSEDVWLKLFKTIRSILNEPQPQKHERLQNMRFRPNDYFTGRESELIRIHEELHSNPDTHLTKGRIRAITAMGGAGKTTLVRQYAEKFWRCYPQIFWVDCRIGFESEFAKIHDILFSEKVKIGLKDAEKALLAFNELSTKNTRLLILDNAEDENTVMPWIPKTGGCYTLITSRFSGWSAVIKTIFLYVLEKEPSVEFLQKRVGRFVYALELKACETLAEKLGYLPLALEQAAAFIEQQEKGFSFHNYIELYEVAAGKLLSLGALGSTEYPDSVITTWKPTVDKLDISARLILQLSSLFASTHIPLKMMVNGTDLIIELIQELSGELINVNPGSQELWFRSHFMQLKSYSMVKVDDNYFSIHPLIQKVEQMVIKEEEKHHFINKATDILINFAPELADIPNTWSTWNILFPHAKQLKIYFNHIPDESKIKLLDLLARYSFGKANYQLSLDYEKEALNLAEETYGADAKETEDRYLNCGESYRETGDYEQAEHMFRKSLEWQLKHNDTSYSDIANSYNYLGLSFLSRDQYDEAEKYFSEGLDICKEHGIDKGLFYIKLLSNLAEVKLHKGKAKVAEQLSELAYNQAEKELDTSHPIKFHALMILSVSLNNQNKTKLAASHMKKVAEKFSFIYGYDHPYTQGAIDVLIKITMNLGEFEESEKWNRILVQTKERLLGSEDHKTLIALENHAEILYKKKDYLEAEKIYYSTYLIRKKIDGPNHKDTIKLRNLYRKFILSIFGWPAFFLALILFNTIRFVEKLMAYGRIPVLILGVISGLLLGHLIRKWYNKEIWGLPAELVLIFIISIIGFHVLPRLIEQDMIWISTWSSIGCQWGLVYTLFYRIKFFRMIKKMFLINKK